MPHRRRNPRLGACLAEVRAITSPRLRVNRRSRGGAEGAEGAERIKFPIAIAVLRRVDAGTLSLDTAVTIEPKDFSPGWSPLRDRAKGKRVTVTNRELLALMLRDSDNTPCDYYIRLLGAKAITREI